MNSWFLTSLFIVLPVSVALSLFMFHIFTFLDFSLCGLLLRPQLCEALCKLALSNLIIIVITLYVLCCSHETTPDM